MPSSGSTGTACCTAWPVPSWGIWRTKLRASPKLARIASSTNSAPWPVITTWRSAFSEAVVRTTCDSMGWPASLCSTLGREDFMRVPLPAAMITMERDMYRA